MNSNYTFPEGFIWGAATAAYQIEGKAAGDPMGLSIWDTFCKRESAIKDGSSGDDACRSIDFHERDIDALNYIGANAYRFSVSWPRLFPKEGGEVSPAGVDYYSRLIDDLLGNGITPFITLYHWDLPQYLEDKGGWQNRETAFAFADYAKKVVGLFQDRVEHWMTFNEISTGLGKGYRDGIFAPGLRLQGRELANVFHHAALAHALAVREIKTLAPTNQAGIVCDPLTPVPLLEDEEHIEACRKAYSAWSGYWLDPLLQGTYPEDYAGLPDIKEGDMDLLAPEIDFLGLNIYSGIYVRAGGEQGFEAIEFPRDYPSAHDLDWMKIVPPALYWGPRFATERYGADSIFITENGYSTDGALGKAETCNDLDRIHYIKHYLMHLHRAIREYGNIEGYFCWSLLDNFEWSEGYTKRLGLFHTDDKTFERVPKLSADWYRAVIRHNAIV